MIEIRPVNGSFFNGIVAEGHAEYDELGKDIVCAGVTSSIITCYSVLAGIFGETMIGGIFEPGYICLSLSDKNEISDSIISGTLEVLIEMTRQYPENIKLEELR